METTVKILTNWRHGCYLRELKTAEPRTFCSQIYEIIISAMLSALCDLMKEFESSEALTKISAIESLNVGKLFKSLWYSCSPKKWKVFFPKKQVINSDGNLIIFCNWIFSNTFPRKLSQTSLFLICCGIRKTLQKNYLLSWLLVLADSICFREFAFAFRSCRSFPDIHSGQMVQIIIVFDSFIYRLYLSEIFKNFE